MVFPNSGEKDLKMRIIVTDPILRELCVLFRIQITLLRVNFRCKSTLKDSMFLVIVLVLDILLAKAADDSIAAVESHGFLIIVDPSQHQKDWT